MICTRVMTDKSDGGPLILVLEDVEETRDAIQALLEADGYRTNPARNEQDALLAAKREHPSLILMSGFKGDVLAVASRVRECAGLGSHVPVVIFCVETIAEGAEVEVQRSIYATRPDNFDQLKAFLHRLLDQPLTAL